MKHVILWFPERGWIRDKYGRIRILRGCSVCAGDTCYEKAPEVYGRPFPEEQADEHFMRLKRAGCTFLRWCITWDSVEHLGPGEYDEDYLAYVRRILKKAEEYDITVIISPVMHAWCSATGGAGAPEWTLKKLGFNLNRLKENGAVASDNSFPVQNYQLYACMTMYTLFFAGNTFAPHCKIDGTPVQEYLQECYTEMLYHVARRLKDCDAIAGIEMFCEPWRGYIGLADLNEYDEPLSQYGIFSTPFNGMKAASGFSVPFKKVEHGLLFKRKESEFTVNANVEHRKPLFEDGFSCPWMAEGVWHIENGQPVLDKPFYFSGKDGKSVDFANSYLKPFYKDVIAALQKKHPQYMFFSPLPLGAGEAAGIWNTQQDEEAFSIVESLAFNAEASAGDNTEDAFDAKLEKLALSAKKNGIPGYVAEFGVDFSGAKKAKKDSDKKQEQLLGKYFDSLDKYMLSSSLWNYTPASTLENSDGSMAYSVFCSDTHDFRAAKGFIRPYAMAVAGVPVKMTFTAEPAPEFVFEWDSIECPAASGECDTEIFLPKIWFPNGWKVERFDGVGALREVPEEQKLFIKTLEARRCLVKIIGNC